jgi:hypothetical protein
MIRKANLKELDMFNTLLLRVKTLLPDNRQSIVITYCRNEAVTSALVLVDNKPLYFGQVTRFHKDKENAELAKLNALHAALTSKPLLRMGIINGKAL